MIEKEKVLERKLVNRIKKIKGWCIKFFPMFISGFPDRICLLPGGIIFFAEIKETGKKPDPVQSVIHKKLKRLGFTVEVVDSTDHINRIMKRYE